MILSVNLAGFQLSTCTSLHMHARSPLARTHTNDNNKYNNISPAGKSDIHSRVESALQDVNEKFLNLESTEKTAVRTALVEERSRYCHFMSCLKPVIVSAQPCQTQSWTVYERFVVRHISARGRDITLTPFDSL